MIIRKIVNGMLIITILVIYGCEFSGNNEESEINTGTTEINKTNYYIETLSLSGSSNFTTVKKIGRIKSSENINVNSQALGKISLINVKEGSNIYKGQLLLSMSDTIGSYVINLDRSNNTLEKAKINYDSTKISLDKAVEDSRIALEKAKKDLQIAEKDLEKQINQAQKDFDSSDLSNEESNARLNLEKLKKDLEKAKIDLETSKKSDVDTINQFVENGKVQYKTIVNFLDNTIYKVDSIIGYTDKNKHLNDSFERYLGNKDSSIEPKVNKQFVVVMELRDELDNYDQENMNIDDIKQLLKLGADGYDMMNNLLELLLNLLKNSSTSSNFSQETLNSYISTFESLKSSIQASYGTFTSFKSQVNSFLSTYIDSQQSIEKNISILEQQIKIQENSLEEAEFSSKIGLERTSIQGEERLYNLETAIENAQLNLDTAKKNRDITLQSLQNAIDSAEISYKESQKEVGKLSVYSPINGIIDEVFVDVGQEVSVGTKLFSIISDSDQQIEIGVTSDEVTEYIVGEKLKIVYKNNNYTGTILSVSNIADDNLTYNILVGLDSPVNLIGDIVYVYKNIKLSNLIIPINSVYPSSRNKGYIYVYDAIYENLERISVDLGKVIGDNVEVLTTLSGGLDIVLTDVSNFHDQRNQIVVK